MVEKAQVVEKSIRDIEIPNECVVAAIIRGNDFVVPRGGTVIKTADHVIFVGSIKAIKKAQEIFSIKK